MIDVRPAAGRFHTDLGWLDSWHSFSFGGHHDPANTHHGLLLVSNDDTVAPGAGFPAHAHRDMEIVTWVLDGELEHADTLGNRGVIRPGQAQRMSAGTGIRHSEMNASTVLPVRFVQMWVRPDRAGVDPGYEQVDVSAELAGGGLVAVAGGAGRGPAVTIAQAGAELRVGRLARDERVAVPDAPHVHLFVATGSVGLADGEGGAGGATDLGRGDAARLTDAGTPEVTAGADGAEILVWATT